MSLRGRLIISFTALLLLAIAAVGFVASRSVRTILTRQVDQQIAAIANRGGPLLPQIIQRESRPQLPRSVALVLVDEQGNVIRSAPSGFRDNPDPLPDLSGTDLTSRHAGFAPARTGRFEYRILVVPTPSSGTVVLAIPLHQVADAQRQVIRAMLVAGSIVAALGALATWLTVRRELRPVEDMVETAEAIAAGDLTRRVPDTSPATELGRLGHSLNEMLAHIEHAVATERDAKERLRQFVGDASHELRTPIAAISGYAQLYERGGLTESDDLDRAMGRIASESKRMQKLVEDLLALARLDQVPLSVPARVDLVKLARVAILDAGAIDPEHRISFDSPPSLIVTGDESQLTQVIANLLANARQHTPPRTPVEVGLSASKGRAILTVTDHGPGIPDEAIERIFERFYRIDSSRSRARGGSGLGLAIVSAIVASHNGTISAENAPGAGARITVSLPLAPD
ncbi:MAG: HAMP domain-containing sensor histidine kinase [Acidimicrobiia bacterium]